jgi:hypothetical protein
MRGVVKKEVLKLVKARVIYLVSDSESVSPVQVVLKKGGMTVIHNEKNEHIPQWTITGWQMCIDYRKLNKAIQKDQFPLPFTNEMLERLANHLFFYYLDGYSGYHHILIHSDDQTKNTFIGLRNLNSVVIPRLGLPSFKIFFPNFSRHPEDRVPLHTSSKLRQGAGCASTHGHASYSFRPHVPAEVDSRATMCPAAPSLTSVLR